MNEVFIPLDSQSSQSILCHYKNSTNQIQVARISNIKNWYFERVMFPGERIMFEALPEAELEIHMMDAAVSAMLVDTILCSHLKIGD